MEEEDSNINRLQQIRFSLLLYTYAISTRSSSSLLTWKPSPWGPRTRTSGGVWAVRVAVERRGLPVCGPAGVGDARVHLEHLLHVQVWRHWHGGEKLSVKISFSKHRLLLIQHCSTPEDVLNNIYCSSPPEAFLVICYSSSPQAFLIIIYSSSLEAFLIMYHNSSS